MQVLVIYQRDPWLRMYATPIISLNPTAGSPRPPWWIAFNAARADTWKRLFFRRHIIIGHDTITMWASVSEKLWLLVHNVLHNLKWHIAKQSVRNVWITYFVVYVQLARALGSRTIFQSRNPGLNAVAIQKIIQADEWGLGNDSKNE